MPMSFPPTVSIESIVSVRSSSPSPVPDLGPVPIADPFCDEIVFALDVELPAAVDVEDAEEGETVAEASGTQSSSNTDPSRRLTTVRTSAYTHSVIVNTAQTVPHTRNTCEDIVCAR